MPMETLTKNVDRDLYKDAISWRGPEGERVSAVRFFAALAEKEGVAPDTKELAERESHYLKRYKVQPWMISREERVKEYARDTYAIEAFYRDQGVEIKGPEAPTVAKAFGVNAGTLAVFPVFYDTMIVSGILAQPLLDRLVAETVQVTTGTADHVTMNEQTWQRQTGEIGEWTRFPEMTVSYSQTGIKLKKWGGILKSSDEAVRRARLPVFQRALERIGRQLANDLTDFALDVALTGDGTTTGTAATVKNAAVNGSPTYADLVELMMQFREGYEPSDLVGTKESWLDILTMPEFKDPTAGFNFQRTGAPPTPLGLNLWRWDSTASSGWSTSRVMMFDPSIMLVQYQEGGIQSESDRIINGQWSEVTTSLYTAFAILDPESRKIGGNW